MGKKVEKIKLELQEKKFAQLNEINRTFEMKEAIVHVKPGESKETAWARHLFDNPLDVNAVVKIFIVPNNHKSS